MLEERGIGASTFLNVPPESKSPSAPRGEASASREERADAENPAKDRDNAISDGPLKVEVGSTVTYVNEDESDGVRQALITREKSNPEFGLINANTPIAKALLGAQVGQIVVAQLPMGSTRLRVVDISPVAHREGWV